MFFIRVDDGLRFFGNKNSGGTSVSPFSTKNCTIFVVSTETGSSDPLRVTGALEAEVSVISTFLINEAGLRLQARFERSSGDAKFQILTVEFTLFEKYLVLRAQ